MITVNLYVICTQYVFPVLRFIYYLYLSSGWVLFHRVYFTDEYITFSEDRCDFCFQHPFGGIALFLAGFYPIVIFFSVVVFAYYFVVSHFIFVWEVI